MVSTGSSKVADSSSSRPEGARVGGEIVRAGGGIVVRTGESGRIEVAVVHRPRRIDWSLPKGKLEPGELLEDGALREVEEETGLRCSLERFVGYTEYVDRRGRPKIVAYWRMEVISGSFRPNQEVDELRWLERTEAVELLTYARDRDLLMAMEEFSLARTG